MKVSGSPTIHEIALRVAYKEATYTSHLTPNHDLSDCRDSVYPLVKRSEAQVVFIYEAILDNLGNILISGTQTDTYDAHTPIIGLNAMLWYLDQRLVPYWATNTFHVIEF